MDRILSWNVRGMNSPNKQEDIQIFLHQQQVGLVGFLKTKIKEQNIDSVMGRICPNCGVGFIMLVMKSEAELLFVSTQDIILSTCCK